MGERYCVEVRESEDNWCKKIKKIKEVPASLRGACLGHSVSSPGLTWLT